MPLWRRRCLRELGHGLVSNRERDLVVWALAYLDAL